MFNRSFGFQNSVKNTGFGDNPTDEAWELLDKKGNPNVRKVGLPWYQKFSVYHFLIAISWTRFFLCILAYYTIINFVFAMLYLITGVHNIHIPSDSHDSPFWTAFFFSSQTLTTVGFGHLYPIGFWTSQIASAESLIGQMNFALIAGLIYSRFSIPKAFVTFSKNVLFNFQDGVLENLMFRIVPYKDDAIISGANMKVLVMVKENNKFKYFHLDLEISNLDLLSLNWTIVHHVDTNSPFFNITEDMLRDMHFQVIIFFSAFDEFFANQVKKRKTYGFEDVLINRKFVKMYYQNSQPSYTVLEINKLNETENFKSS